VGVDDTSSTLQGERACVVIWASLLLQVATRLLVFVVNLKNQSRRRSTITRISLNGLRTTLLLKRIIATKVTKKLSQTRFY